MPTIKQLKDRIKRYNEEADEKILVTGLVKAELENIVKQLPTEKKDFGSGEDSLAFKLLKQKDAEIKELRDQLYGGKKPYQIRKPRGRAPKVQVQQQEDYEDEEGDYEDDQYEDPENEPFDISMYTKPKAQKQKQDGGVIDLSQPKLNRQVQFTELSKRLKELKK